MYKFGPALSYNLHESDQPNPLRWEVSFREGDNFTPQTALFRCKDYFNDYVGVYQGYFGLVYGMDTKKVKLNTDGVWVRLFNIKNQNGVFVDNINAVVNAELSESLGVTLTLEELDPTTFLLFIPRKVFDCTWYISLTTYLIRLCNYGIPYESFEQLSKSKFKEPNYLRETVCEFKFNIPAQLSAFWYYANPTYNSEKLKNITILHNNGISSLSDAYNAHLKTKKELPCDATAATIC